MPDKKIYQPTRCFQRAVEAAGGVSRFSRLAGVQPVSLRRFLRGGGNLSLPTIAQLTRYLGWDAEDIFRPRR